ncbi:ComEA family DNA-binding protein [Nocardia concava]|uniref:ComEA family DNA-binding protein n=1 Tax=Nocardia concava TaxID=257281 RepID=UPI0002F153B2|nr:ComEA family DNA-binding protein [Nocardia concava]
MPQLDERTPLHRLNATPRSERRSGRAEAASTPAESASSSAQPASGSSHPARWDEDSLDHLIDPPCPAEDRYGADRDTGGFAAPAWLSEPCGSISVWHERLVPERFRGTRWDPGPRGVLVIAALGLFALLLAGYVSLRERPESLPVPPIASLTEPAPAEGDSPPFDGPTASAGADAPGGSGAAVGPGAPVGGGTSAQVAPPAPGGSRPLATGPTAAPQPGRNPVAPTVIAAPGGPAVAATPGEVVVSVVGLVEHGGLRRFPVGARVADALRAAAPRPEADLSALNLAQPLTDGDQIIVARTATRPTGQQTGTTIVNSAHPVGNSPPPTSGSPRSTGAAAKVNLNTATEAELDTLPGVGPVTAKAILTWRSRHGRFTSVDQLAEIEGIGHARLNRLRERVTI